jgi:hypothetical protein
MHYPFPLAFFKGPDGLTVQMRLAKAQIERIAFQRSEGAFWINGIEVSKPGVDLYDVLNWFRYQPDGWLSFTGDRADDWKLSGSEAVAFYGEFTRQIFERDVMVAIFRLEKGFDTPDSLQSDHPELFESPRLLRFIAENQGAGIPHARRGPPKGGRPTRKELELYFHVKLLEMRGRKQNVAISIILRRYPDLIPRTWKNPHDSLRKAVRNRDREGWFYSKPLQ